MRNKGKKIGIAGNQSTSADLINALLRNKYKIECIINMQDDLNGKIAGYLNLASLARKHKIPLVRPKKYSLQHEDDRKNLLKYKLDVLLVFGWQRLIPSWLLESLSIGAFGTHGSWKPLPYGRGRSLLNWSLILGKNKLLDNLFRYDKGADSGEIIETFKFEITLHDTIQSLHHKDQLVHQEMLLKHLPDILQNKIKLKKQSKKVKEVFFPKRSPDDGVIDWSWSTKDLYNLIRALGKPYPGAFTFSSNKKIMIWSAIPFQMYPSYRVKLPGVIVSAFSDNTFVVKTGDGALLITEHESKNWVPILYRKFKSKHNYTYDLLKKEKISW